MPTIYVKGIASEDDAYEIAGTVSLTGSFVSDATNEWFGWRFQSVAIPNGATINSATLILPVSAAASDEPDHTFFGNDVDDAAQFSTGASDISGRARTTASVVWSSADLASTGSSYHNPPDLSAIVQEIVDRGGWLSGNDLAFVCQGSADANRDLGIILHTVGSTTGARLVVNYEIPGTTEWTGQVAASADDARQSATVVTIDGTALEADAADEWLGLRFDGVVVPQGATIHAASLLVAFAVTGGDEPDHPIYGEDADDAAQFTTGASDITARSRTAATVTWSSADLVAENGTLTVIPLFEQSPDLSDIVQEIVDRAGWASGNAMAFLINGSADANRDLSIIAYDGTPSFAAKLEVVHEGGVVVADAGTENLFFWRSRMMRR